MKRSYMQIKKIVILPLLIFCLPVDESIAEAENQTDILPEVIVTGTIIDAEGIYQHIPRYSLSSNDIDAISPSTSVDLLRRVPGLDVTQLGGGGGITSVSIRGGDPNFTVVLIDGVKVDDPTNTRGGGFDFAGLDPLMIEHIDVFYGGYSAVYGSDALAGIISVTTRRNSSSTRAGTIEVGTNDAWATALHVSGPLNDGLSASMSAVVRQGNDSVEGDSLKRQQLSLKLNNNTTSSAVVDWGLNFFVSDTKATAFPIGSGGDQLAELRDVEVRSFDQSIVGGTIEWHPSTKWQANLVGGWASYREENDSPGIAPGTLSGVPPVLTHSQYERGNVTFSNTISISKTLILGFGAEVIGEEGEIESLIDFGIPIPANFRLTRDTWAVFGEGAISLGNKVTVIASLRHDDIDEVSSTNGRLAATFNFSRTNSSVSLIYAEAFKLPSLFALGHALTGNPDLKPESSQNVALNFQQAFANQNATMSLNLYYNKFEDLVDFDTATFMHVNRASATAKGIELTLDAAFGKTLQLTSNIGYLNTEVSDGTNLERRPEWKAGFELAWTPTKAWLTKIYGYYNGDFYDVAVPTGEILLDGYTNIGVSFHRAVTDKVDIKLLIDNVFDRSYEEAVGFSTAGRQARLALSAHF